MKERVKEFNAFPHWEGGTDCHDFFVEYVWISKIVSTLFVLSLFNN